MDIGMKKIVLPNDLKALIEREKSFLNRAGFRIFAVNTKEAALDIHCSEKVNLIIMDLDMPTMGCEEFCSIIRNDRELRNVSIIVICNDSGPDIERSSRCKANAFITSPIDPAVFFDRVYQLLNISRRGSYRVLLSVNIQGNHKSRSFFCRSENISASGILVETDRVLFDGDVVTCSFFLPDSTHIISEGRIVRALRRATEFDTNQYGIMFSNLPEESRYAIELFIKNAPERGGKNA